MRQHSGHMIPSTREAERFLHFYLFLKGFFYFFFIFLDPVVCVVYLHTTEPRINMLIDEFAVIFL